MKKRTAKLTALALASMMALAGCGGNGGNASSSGSGEASSEGLTELHAYETINREVENLNILNTQTATDTQVLGNLIDGMLTNDTKGNLQPCLAESYDSEDNITWTFHLREGVKWVDMNGEEKADCPRHKFPDQDSSADHRNLLPIRSARRSEVSELQLRCPGWKRMS